MSLQVHMAIEALARFTGSHNPVCRLERLPGKQHCSLAHRLVICNFTIAFNANLCCAELYYLAALEICVINSGRAEQNRKMEALSSGYTKGMNNLIKHKIEKHRHMGPPWFSEHWWCSSAFPLSLLWKHLQPPENKLKKYCVLSSWTGLVWEP